MEQSLSERFYPSGGAFIDDFYQMKSMQRQAVYAVDGSGIDSCRRGSGSTTVIINRIAI